MSTALHYRPEIDGLRAVAVIPVVVFHLQAGWMPGGFAGVDVFFVISGFLITSIILRESEAGTFTLRNFWMRRIRRLFPALAVVLVAVLLAGMLMLYESEWRSLGPQVQAVLMLVANVFMGREAGDYWGPAAGDVPLLHTWSLAVEEQFYLVFPLLLVVLLKAGRRLVFPALAVGAVLSFGYGLLQVRSDPARAFYLLPPRAWELLTGGLLAAWIWRGKTTALRGASMLAAVGLLMILASYFVIRSGTGFPGWIALLPTLGTVLVLAFATTDGGVVTRILSVPSLVFVGKISYSLYLWHWPVIVFWRLHTQAEVSELRHAVLIVVISVVAATLSYFLVEKPFRRPAFPLWSRKGAVISGTFACLVAVALAVPAGWLRSFAEPSFGTPVFTGQEYSAEHGEQWRSGGVIVGGAPPEIVVIGSSHAIMYGATVADIAQEQDRGVAFLCMGNAFGRFHSEGDNAIFRDGMAAEREEFDAARMRYLKGWKPECVLWFGRWENQLEILGEGEFDRVIRKNLQLVLEHAERVVLTTQVPFAMKQQGSILRYATHLAHQGKPVVGEEDPERTVLRRKANGMLRRMAEEDPRVTVVEVADLFELENGAVRIVSDDRRLLYHDDNHLSDHGAALVRERIVGALVKVPGEGKMTR